MADAEEDREGRPFVECVVCGQAKAPLGRSAPMMGDYCQSWCEGYAKDPQPDTLWPGEKLSEFGYGH